MANIEIGGRLHSTATGNVVTGANEVHDDIQNKKQQEINAELIEAVGAGGSVDSRIAAAKAEIKGNATSACDTLGEAEALISAEATRAQAAEDDRYTKTETYSKTELNNMITTPNQKYVSVTATDQTTSVTDVLPATGAADTTYRVGNWDGTQYNDSVFSEYAWDGSAYIKLSTKSQIGEVYDISANHADTKYADLSAALGINGANIPQSLRKGGMSVKYVSNSDNNYIQFSCIANEFTTDTAYWKCNDNKGLDYIELNYNPLIVTDTVNGVKWDMLSVMLPKNKEIFFEANESGNVLVTASDGTQTIAINGITPNTKKKYIPNKDIVKIGFFTPNEKSVTLTISSELFDTWGEAYKVQLDVNNNKIYNNILTKHYGYYNSADGYIILGQQNSFYTDDFLPIAGKTLHYEGYSGNAVAAIMFFLSDGTITYSQGSNYAYLETLNVVVPNNAIKCRVSSYNSTNFKLYYADSIEEIQNTRINALENRTSVMPEYPIKQGNGFRGIYRMSISDLLSTGYTVEFLANLYSDDFYQQGVNNVDRYITTGLGSNGISIYRSSQFYTFNITVLNKTYNVYSQDKWKFKKFVHVVICVPSTQNTENVKVFVNGVKVIDEGVTSSDRYANLTINGDYADVEDSSKNRYTHHVNVFKGCLSDTECINLYNNNNPSEYVLPQAYYTNDVINRCIYSFYAEDMQNDNVIINRANKDTLTSISTNSYGIIYGYNWNRPCSKDVNQLSILSMGDSITTDAYYQRVIRQLFNSDNFVNLAVASATWADRSGTTSYDGNPQFQGDQNQNVLGNQLQKLINGLGNGGEYEGFVPDIIWIAAGTNDGSYGDYTHEQIEEYFTSNGSWIDMGTAWTETDNYSTQRKNIVGAIRYVCTHLRLLFPKSRIYICTPIQRSGASSYSTIRVKDTLITNVAKRMSLPVIPVGEICGIYGDFEEGGSNYSSEQADLGDGLHPGTTSGREKMAYCIYNFIMKDFQSYTNVITR